MVYKFKKRCSILAAIREMKIKITMRYHYIPVLHTRMCRTEMSKNTKVVTQLELSNIVDGSIEGTTILENCLAVSNKAKYLMPCYISNRNKCLYPPRDICKKVHSSVVYKRQKKT